MNQGKKFEHNFKQACENDEIFCLRLTDSDLSFNPNKDLRSRFTVKQPADLIVYYDGYLFTLELKNTKGKNFSFQRDPKLPDCMIHYHQINSLVNMGLCYLRYDFVHFHLQGEDCLYSRVFYSHLLSFTDELTIIKDAYKLKDQSVIQGGTILDWLGYEPSDDDYTREEVRTFIDFHADEELNEVIQEYLTKS